jgi:raffinose/stachyose/melibiose transport system substrate-binding protein
MMRIVRRALMAITALVLTAELAVAQTNVRWLHIEANPVQVKIWEEVARDFEAKNPGVKVDMQYLENEAYKAKAPTLLQSRDRPHIIYSWAGGVLKAQVAAGVLEDITTQVQDHKDKLSASAVAAFTVDDRSTVCRTPFRRSASWPTRSCSARQAWTRAPSRHGMTCWMQ